jgi:hypothetical protein
VLYAGINDRQAIRVLVYFRKPANTLSIHGFWGGKKQHKNWYILMLPHGLLLLNLMQYLFLLSISQQTFACFFVQLLLYFCFHPSAYVFKIAYIYYCLFSVYPIRKSTAIRCLNTSHGME